MAVDCSIRHLCAGLPSHLQKMSVVALTPDAARNEADRNRQLLLDPALSKYEAEEIANQIAQCVSGYGEVDERIEELKLPESNKTKAQAKANCREPNASATKLSNTPCLTWGVTLACPKTNGKSSRHGSNNILKHNHL